MSKYTDFFEELIIEVPYSLAVELKDLPKEEWAETTQQWFQDTLYVVSSEPLDDQPLSELWELLLSEIDWEVVVKLITKIKINKAIKEVEE
ncbi:MAG: hypothetical protein WBM32_06095 [Crocosphaera sp.]